MPSHPADMNPFRRTPIVVLTGIVLLAATAVSQASDPRNRVLKKQVTVTATLDEIWHCWTTSEGVASFFAPESKIELKVGGAYELYIAKDAPIGQRGSEGCRVLSYIPNEMLSFEWLAPPAVPTLRKAGAKTHVVLWFSEVVPGTVSVELLQFGWGEGQDWNDCYAYFDGAWANVLKNLRRRFERQGASTPAPRPSVDDTVKPTHLECMARLVGGSWHYESQEPNGIVIHARLDHQWGVAKKTINSQSYLIHEGEQDMIHETYYVWHPQKRQIVFWSVSAWDTLYEGVVKPEGDTLTYEWESHGGDDVKSYRQSLKFLDNDTYEWTVELKTPTGWEHVKDGKFERRPS